MHVHGCSGGATRGSIARGLKRLKLLQRLRSSRVSRDHYSSSSGSSSLGSDWLQRTSSSSWELFSEEGSHNDGYDHHSDDEELYLPKDVPEGFLAVYVGEERKRFVVDARHLNHPWFKILLERSAEEFGFDHKGGLTLPCRVVVFESLLGVLERGDTPSLKQLAQIEELLAV